MLIIGEYDFADTWTVENIKNDQIVTANYFFQQILPVAIQILLIFVFMFVTLIMKDLITGLTVLPSVLSSDL